MAKRQQKAKVRGKGSQLDALKRIRKEMPPATRVIKPKTNKSERSKRNWRDFLDEDFDERD